MNKKQFNYLAPIIRAQQFNFLKAPIIRRGYFNYVPSSIYKEEVDNFKPPKQNPLMHHLEFLLLE
jgi:hypothetical protein